VNNKQNDGIDEAPQLDRATDELLLFLARFAPCKFSKELVV